MRIIKLKGMRQVNGLHYAPDGRRLLAVGGYEVRSIDEARWVDVVAGTETLRVPLHATCYAVSPDLTRMAVGSMDPLQENEHLGPVVTFDPSDPTWHEDESRRREVHELGWVDHVFGLALSSDGKWLAVSHDDFGTDSTPPSPRFVIVPLGGRKKKVEMQDASASTSHVLTFSPDGTHIAASGGAEGSSSVGIIETVSLEYTHAFGLSGTRTRSLVYSPDGETLAAANSKSVHLVPHDSEVARVTLAHPKQVNAVAFTPDGRRILTTCTDKLVQVVRMRPPRNSSPATTGTSASRTRLRWHRTG